jgi:hypothetical protein
MDFNKISRITTCDCLHGFHEDTNSIFVRRVDKRNRKPKERDFKVEADKETYVPKEPLPNNSACKSICEDFELSIDIITPETEDAVIERCRKTLEVSGTLNKHLCKFQLKEDAGVVKYTPNQESGYNPYHHDFIKDDNFTLEKIQVLSMVSLDV